MLLRDRVAVVTGGAQGIGLAIARTFVEHGARVVVADVDATAAATAADDLGGDCLGLGCDVARAEDVAAVVQAAVTRLGGLHVMVNNAGITRDATMRTMTEAQFDDVIAVNLKGCWNGTRLAAAHMRQAGGGSIVNMASISGKAGFAGQTNYSAAKAGVVGLSKAAAKEVAHLGVRVNVVMPAFIRSAMTDAIPEAIRAQRIAEIPMQRPGEPEEVADVVLFYASDLSSYMTGTVAEVSGGRLI